MSAAFHLVALAILLLGCGSVTLAPSDNPSPPDAAVTLPPGDLEAGVDAAPDAEADAAAAPDGAPAPTDAAADAEPLDAPLDAAPTDAGLDDDATVDAAPRPTLSIADTSQSYATYDVPMTFTVTLSAPVTHVVTVRYVSADGTATSQSIPVGDQDYVPVRGTLVFAPGETTKTVDVVVRAGELWEPTETMTITLYEESGADLARPVGTGSISFGDGTPPVINIRSADPIEGNPSGRVLVEFELSVASTLPIKAHVFTDPLTALAGADFDAVDGEISFPPGTTVTHQVVWLRDDAVPEPPEAFYVRLDKPVNAVVTPSLPGQIIIHDDDGPLPSMTIDDPSVVEGDSGRKTMTFTVSLSKPPLVPITVDYETSPLYTSAGAGEDFLRTFGTLTFAPGETEKPIVVTILGDKLNEGDQTVGIALSNTPPVVSLDDGVGQGVIIDDDPLPVLSVADVSHVEGNAGDSFMVFTLKLSTVSGRDVALECETQDVTASSAPSPGVDYMATLTTVTIPAGLLETELSLYIWGDTTVEPNETFLLRLLKVRGAVLARPAAKGTIVNDD